MSYGLLARLGAIESDQGDLEASINALQNSKQDNLNNATADEGEVVKVGSNLKRIGTKDNTLSVETTGDIIKFGVNKSVTHHNPVFTGNVEGINKSMVGLSNVDNTSDADKQISTATQSALSTYREPSLYRHRLHRQQVMFEAEP